MAWASLGNLYKTARKDIPTAVNAYEHAVEGIKKDKVVWSNLGMAYYRNNQTDQALKALVTDGTYKTILGKWGVDAGAIDNPAVNP